MAAAGGATTGQKETYVQWLSVRNPNALCDGEADCVQQPS